jgi:hypothetical protein
MVFRDCIVLHGTYEYRPEQMAEQVLHHIAIGRTLYYHSLGDHLYWLNGNDHAELPYPAAPCDPAVFTRAHNGWAEGFCLWDRFMKNTHEVLGPLNRLTSLELVERYEFLDPAGCVRRTVFSHGATALVNGSEANWEVQSALGGRVLLPPYGFLIEAGPFAAFHALAWGGREYAAPVLFTLTALDGGALLEADRVRVFHGFGDAGLTLRDRSFDIRREALVGC